MPLDDAAYLPLLRAELDAFAATLDRDLTALVPTCAPWTLADLTAHLGDIHRWALVAATEGRGDHEPPPAPRDPDALRQWFAEGAAALVGGLSMLDPGQPCWTIWTPREARFWWRRQALEALVHRYDAQLAVERLTPLPVDLAADGIDEVCGTLFPRQVALGRTTEPRSAFLLRATDVGAAWQLGSAAPTVAVTGSAADLLLLLWRRLDLSQNRFTVDGDPAALVDALDRPLTP